MQPTNFFAGAALGTSDLVVPVPDIASIRLKNAGRVMRGCLEIWTRGGQRYRLYFTREQQPGFEALHAELQANIPHESLRPHNMGMVEGPITPGPEQGSRSHAWPVPQGPLVLRGSGSAYFPQEVVGESFYGAHLSRVAGREEEGERKVFAELRREPSNRHDSNAVQVLIDGGVVGHLPREDAPLYQPELKAVESWGRPAMCRARLWWRRESRREVFASVSLDLARPGELLPIASPDTSVPHVTVPAGRSYQVKVDHSEVLAGLLAQAYVPGKALAYASLHLVERAGPRSTTQIVVVRIGDVEVGGLSKQTSAKLTALLAPLRDAQVKCYAEASLTGNAIAAEVRVYLTMPENLPPEFVRQVQVITSQA
ncbi:HIRAN domain-containing protein [Streptomyces diastatochromogenes]|uniref:HIRAN domain-containing protein n=1 Tax=Streptomyces diastatochromogenes TaxID=42236 RepID=UPI00365AE7E4